MPARECSRTACSGPAVSTLTYVYEDSTAVLGPLSRTSEPHSYDLCHDHAVRLTAPRGWRLLRVAGGEEGADDLVAIADAVRPAGPGPASGRPAARSAPAHREDPATRPPGAPGPSVRHLHVVRETGGEGPR